MIRISIFLCILVLVSCRGKEAMPTDVMAKDKMQAVLWDMMRADQFLTNYLLKNDTGKDRQAETIKLYQQVLTIHNISKEDLQKSLDYYKARPILMKEIMDSLSKPVLANAPTLPVADTVKPQPIKEEQIVEPVSDTAVRSFRDTSNKIFRDTSRRRPRALKGN